jgi:hypothetical protein
MTKRDKPYDCVLPSRTAETERLIERLREEQEAVKQDPKRKRTGEGRSFVNGQVSGLELAIAIVEEELS